MIRALLVVTALLALSPIALAQDLAVYEDTLLSGFEDWSWATHDLSWSAQTHAGTDAIRMEPDAWEGLYFHRNLLASAADFVELRLWLRGESLGGQQLRLVVQLNGSERANVDLDAFVAGGAISGALWREAVVSLVALGLTSGSFNELTLQADSAGDQSAVLFDDLRFVADPTPPGPLTIAVDAALDRRPISAFVYGVNFASAAQIADVGYTVNRWGGNRTTRYNWQLDVDNSAFDWFFFNYEGSGDPVNLP